MDQLTDSPGESLLIFVWLSLCVTSLDNFSYSSVSSVGEVNFKYPVCKTWKSRNSRDLCWTFVPHQAQGFLVCLELLFPSWKPAQAFLSLDFLSNSPHLNSWAFYWIISDYYNSFCSWVTLWLLLGQRFAVASLSSSFMGCSLLAFLIPRAGGVTSSSFWAVRSDQNSPQDCLCLLGVWSRDPTLFAKAKY